MVLWCYGVTENNVVCYGREIPAWNNKVYRTTDTDSMLPTRWNILVVGSSTCWGGEERKTRLCVHCACVRPMRLRASHAHACEVLTTPTATWLTHWEEARGSRQSAGVDAGMKLPSHSSVLSSPLLSSLFNTPPSLNLILASTMTFTHIITSHQLLQSSYNSPLPHKHKINSQSN